MSPQQLLHIPNQIRGEDLFDYLLCDCKAKLPLEKRRASVYHCGNANRGLLGFLDFNGSVKFLNSANSNMFKALLIE